MNQDYKDLLSAFQSHGVRYLIVGGYAVIHHSQPRFTNGLDLFIEPGPANARAAYAALAEFGAALHNIRPQDSQAATPFSGLVASRKFSTFFRQFPVSILARLEKRRVKTVVILKAGNANAQLLQKKPPNRTAPVSENH